MFYLFILASKRQTIACSCSNARVSCSEFCRCQDLCQKRWNLRDIDMDDYIESDEDSENGDNDFDDNFI